MVVDALNYGDLSTGGGSIRALAYWNGSQWVWWLGLGGQGGAADVAISGGILTVPEGVSLVTAQAETGTTDVLSTINGLVKGQRVVLQADAGDTITVDEAGNINLGVLGQVVLRGDSGDKLELIHGGTNLDSLATAQN